MRQQGGETSGTITWEMVAREAKPLQSRSAWKQPAWTLSCVDTDFLSLEKQRNLELLSWDKPKNLNLELKSEGIENEDVHTAPVFLVQLSF